MQDSINKGMKYQCNFIVGPGNGSALLGIADCECLQLMSINCQTLNAKTLKIQYEYNSVFTGIGCFKGTFSLQLEDDMKLYKAAKDAYHIPSRNHFKKRKTGRTTNSSTIAGKHNG